MQTVESCGRLKPEVACNEFKVGANPGSYTNHVVLRRLEARVSQAPENQVLSVRSLIHHGQCTLHCKLPGYVLFYT